jgi:alpha,alpha-trehalase
MSMTEKLKARTHFRLLIIILVLIFSAFASPNSDQASADQLRAIQKYIRESWHTLTRSSAQLAKAAPDPKFKPMPDGRWPVYVSQRENIKRIEQNLRAQVSAEDFATIDIRQLPNDPSEVREHGLLYLPHPYVVPGGRFNEMYGWDSYFTQVGLVRDNEMVLAKNMVDNFLYQIDHYGKILNANRTYYLSRSQPPFLTQMILNVYRKQRNLSWLRATVPAIEKYYRFWIEEPHLTRQTGLSRYYDLGDGPAPEVLSGERDDQGRDHYDLVKEYYRTHEVKDYDLSQYYDKGKGQLTDLFYKGDRSMRESGFDPSNRFGPFNVDIIRYDPVCLNSLLYLMETDTAEILRTLGRARQARVWTNRAEARRQSINRLMWDEQDGLYYDYNFVEKRVRRYPFVTTFYPLWVGVADKRQAARIVANLHLFERPGGLLTSTNVSGSQWDAPFGWGPTEMIAVEGLRRYGYAKEADRISVNFLSMILKEFIQHNTIVEKYDVERRESEVSAGLKFGYKSNEIGFGWTNAAFTELYALLPDREKPKVLKLDGVSLPRPEESVVSRRILTDSMRNSSSLVLLKMNFLNSEASVRVAGATQRVSF